MGNSQNGIKYHHYLGSSWFKITLFFLTLLILNSFNHSFF
jgi:hypothetical protein